MKKRPGRPAPAATRTSAPRPAATLSAPGWLSGAYRPLAEFLLILILAFVTYGNAIRNEYNLDDGYVVSLEDADPKAPKGIAAIPEILVSKYSEGPGATYGYRPLGKITLAIEYSLWGNEPHLSHFVNVFLFAVNVFLLLLFLRRAAAFMGYNNEHVIALSVLLFLVHPIHTEVVCSIKNREEILCFGFVLAALLAFFKYLDADAWKRKLLYVAILLICLALSLLSKQTGFNLFGIVALLSAYRVFFASGETLSWKQTFNPQTILRYGLPLLVIGLVLILLLDYLPHRIGQDDMATKFESSPFDFAPAGHKFPIFIQTIGFYLRKLLVPFPLLFYYGYDTMPLPGWNSMLPYAGIAGLLGISALCWYLLFRKRQFFAVFAIGFFIVTLLPFANMGTIFFYVVGIVGERFAYQASAAWCLFFVMGLAWLAERSHGRFIKHKNYSGSQVLLAFCAPFVLVYLLLTWNRNAQWKDKMTLFTHDMRWLERSARANYMTGSHILFQYRSNRPGPETEQARKYFLQALQIYPKYDDVQLALGTLYGVYYRAEDSAKYYFRQIDSVTLQTYVKSRERLGDIYLAQQQRDSAEWYYRDALRSFPKNFPVYRKLSELLISAGKYEEVLKLSDTAVKYDWPTAFMYRGDVWLALHDTTQAVVNYEQALSLGWRDREVARFVENYRRSRDPLRKPFITPKP